jgi:hypothetical protein
MKLTEDEQREIVKRREGEEKLKRVMKEIETILEKEKVTLVVNPDSSLRSPTIMLVGVE